MTVFVVIQAPLLPPPCEDSETAAWMKPPSGRDTAPARRTGLADFRRVEHALVSVQPAIRPQVSCSSLVRRRIKAIQQDLRRTVGRSSPFWSG
jgi:hypothetical protein